VTWVVRDTESNDRQFTATVASIGASIITLGSGGIISEANNYANQISLNTIEVYVEFPGTPEIRPSKTCFKAILYDKKVEYCDNNVIVIVDSTYSNDSEITMEFLEKYVNDKIGSNVETNVAHSLLNGRDMTYNDIKTLETMILGLSTTPQTIPENSIVDTNSQPDPIKPAGPTPQPAPIKPAGPTPQPAPIKPTPEPQPAPINQAPEPQPILPTSNSKSPTVYPCGEGTHEENGKCIPDQNSDWKIFENIQKWFNDYIVKPILSSF